MKTSREIVLLALNKMEQQTSYSNLILEPILEHHSLTSRDRDFVFRMFYGVLERKITLDYVIARFSRIPPSKISTDIRNILRMGIYQLAFMDLEDFAAVNESVNLAKKVRKKSASGFINAILRQFLRDKKLIHYPKKNNGLTYYFSIRYSCPEWLIQLFLDEYGDSCTEQILKQQLGRPPLALRVNTTRISREQLLERLQTRHYTAHIHPNIPDCLIIDQGGNLTSTKEFEEGMFHVQDVASQICSRIAAWYRPDSVLDVCAAPGGKSFTLAEELGDSVPIISCDRHPHRVKLIQKGADRLQLSSINAKQADATVFNNKQGKFDLVLCDVPCSGFGVIRRKPEIKYKSKESLSGLPSIQLKILSVSSQYVKEGGILLYSTCTLSKRENQGVTRRFLEANPEFQSIPLPGWIQSYNSSETASEITLLPSELDSDGFYICAMKKGN